MSAGNLIFLLLIAGGAFAMFSMHRGGGHSHGAGGGCGGHGHGAGHDHGQAPTDNEASTPPSSEGEKKPLLGKPGTRSHEHTAEPVGDGDRHRGC